MIHFEWDENKNIANQKKHGISFEEAVFVFSDKENISIPDIEHSETEERWVTIGNMNRLELLLSYTRKEFMVNWKEFESYLQEEQ